MASTEEKIRSLCKYADRALSDVNRFTSALFQLMAEEAKQCRFDFTTEHQILIEDITSNGLISDSASFINDMVLDAKNGKIIELRLGSDRSRASLNEHIKSALDQHNKNDRGFVYLAWRARPEAFFYVGRAGSQKRVNLDSHGKLLEALKHGNSSTLSLIFPGISTAENIASLEAALIHLIEYKTGSIPAENSRKERLNFEYECGEELASISALLSAVLRRLETRR